MTKLRVGLLAFAILLVAYSGVTSWPGTGTTLMARGDLEALLGAGKLVLIGADPGWGTTNAQLATNSDFTTYFKNTGSCPGTGSQILSSSQLQACLVLTSVHTPILANHSFASNSFASWTSTNTSGCTVGSVGSVPAPAEDSDGGSAGFTSGNTGCAVSGTSTTPTLTQTVSVSGTPTSQTFSFYYNFSAHAAPGDPGCGPQANGTASNLKLIVNGTTVSTTVSPTNDGAWHQVTGSLSSLVNGSNTIVLQVTLTDAYGVLNPGGAGCAGPSDFSQVLYTDNIVLTSTY